VSKPMRVGDILRTETAAVIGTTASSSGEPYTCEHCGQTVNPIETEIFGEPRTYRGTCECVFRRQEEERQRQAEAERRRRIEAKFGLIRFPVRYTHMILDAFEARPGSENAFRAAREYIDRWPEQMDTGEGLMLLGPPGNGKSHLAAAAYHALKARGFVPVLVVVPDLWNTMDATYRAGSTEHEADIYAALIDCDLLVLDDIGPDKPTDKRRERLYTIVNARLLRNRPIIATSNVTDMDELEWRISKRTVDRLMGECLTVRNSASSYREETAAKRSERWCRSKSG